MGTNKPGRLKSCLKYIYNYPPGVFWICMLMAMTGTFVCQFSGSIAASDHVVTHMGESFYFVVVTMTTVGFGDYSPVTDIGKWFAVFWLSTGTVAVANLLGAMMNREIA